MACNVSWFIYSVCRIKVQSLVFKGIPHYTNPELIYNYWTDNFSGEILDSCEEGELEWVKISEAKYYPMQEDIQVRFDLFFEPGTFEIHTMWDEQNNQIDKRYHT